MQRSNAALGTPGKNPEFSCQGIPLEVSLEPSVANPLLCP